MADRIPVTVFTGALGSGKTTLLNRLTAPPALSPAQAGRLVLITNEQGATSPSHARACHVAASLAPAGGGCMCCSMRDELVQALTSLFMAAMHRRVPPCERVLLETAGQADPAAIMYTLRYDPFLAQRYVYAGCVAVVSGRQASASWDEPALIRQAALANVIVLDGLDDVDVSARESLLQGLAVLNAEAQVYRAGELPSLTSLLAVCDGPPPAPLDVPGWRLGPLGMAGLQRGPGNVGVAVLALAADRGVSRGALARAVARVQEAEGLTLLRMKGAVRYDGDSHYSIVQAVHGLSEPPRLPADPQPIQARLVFIARTRPGLQLEALVRSILSDEGVALAQG